MKSFRLIGLMSGTSLDGLDIADVTFNRNEAGKWSYQLNKGITVTYSRSWRERLFSAAHLNGEELHQLSVDLACFYGDKVNTYLSTYDIPKEDIFALSSHGQTIFHQPEKGLTVQIGNLPHLAVRTGINSIVDFRTKDVALGGNGAPLIPIVDHVLFKGKAEGYLNLGGFSNLSFRKNGSVRSFDVGPANIVINHLMKKMDEQMDVDGEIARSGKTIKPLLESLNKIPYYSKEGPKSLGWEWVEEEVLPLFDKNAQLADQLHTYYKHIVTQLVKAFEKCDLKSVMVTGGGVFNTYLMEELKSAYDGKIIVPDDDTVNFKEAIGFAWLGLMRWLEEVNVLSSVTGAQKDSCSGVIYTP